MTLKNALFQTHWLVGITAGIILALVGFTGALLSFETQIVDALNSDVRAVAPRDGAPLAAPQLLARIAAANPDKRITALSVFEDKTKAARVTFASPGGAAARPGEGGQRGRGEQRYVDPYTGEVRDGAGNRGDAFFRQTRQLHRWLMVGELGNRDVGRQIVGACTLLLVLLALSGLYLRWPRGIGGHTLRGWLVPNFKLKGRAFLWNLHAVAGTWVLPVYLLMALTGLQWSYEWYRDGLYAVAGVERPAGQGEGRPREGGAPRASNEAPDLTRAWATFITLPGFSTANITFGAPGRPIEFRYLDQRPAHERAYNTIAIDTDGTTVRHERYDAKSAGGKLVSSIFPLHSGSFFGLAGMIVYLLASLAMPVFAVTGWMMYLQRRRSRARSRAASGLTPAADQP